MENNALISDPLVSICCDTYQHALYIRDALDGFLMQRTNFPFEIIVHDDASTDGTAEILREYEARHPRIFRNIYRTENMYSRDPKILEHYVFPHARGKYIAICEGDDYWISPDKLQRQIDYMEAHPDCTLCFHACKIADRTGEYVGEQRPCASSALVSTEDVIRGMGGFCPTASIVTRTELCKARPAYCDITSVDDAPLQIFFASRGTTYYFAEPMSVYRQNLPGSWSIEQRGLQKEKKTALCESLIAMHEAFDLETNGRWHDAVADALVNDRFELYCQTADVAALKRDPYRRLYRTLPLKTRLRLHLERYCPALYARISGRPVPGKERVVPAIDKRDAE